jgi:Gpi18-like mannosyltransferase
MKQGSSMMKILRATFNKSPWLFYLISVVVYLILFFVFIDKISLDFVIHLDVWYRTILNNGFSFLKNDFYNYAPAYMYLLALATLLPVKSLFGIKLLSLPIVPLAGYFMASMVYSASRDKLNAWLGFTLTVLAPTILINSAYWGQADIFYGTACLACLGFLVQKKPYMAMTAFGIAIAFKAQAVFMGPFLVMMLIKKQIPWKSIFLPPLVFILSGLPVFIVGKPIYDIVFVYLKQADTYKSLCMNCSSMWALFPDTNYDLWMVVGIALTAAVSILYIIAFSRTINVENPHQVVLAALISVVIAPFFLPKMIDRYFYLAELFSIGLLLMDWRSMVIPILLQISAGNVYWQALRRKGFLFPQGGSALINLGVVVLLIWFFWRMIARQAAARPMEK